MLIKLITQSVINNGINWTQVCEGTPSLERPEMMHYTVELHESTTGISLQDLLSDDLQQVGSHYECDRVCLLDETKNVIIHASAENLQNIHNHVTLDSLNLWLTSWNVL